METKLMGQCTRCQKKYELKAKPNEPQRCKVKGCGGMLETYTSSFLPPEQLAQQRSKPAKPPRSKVGEVERPATIIKQKSREDKGMAKTQAPDGTPVQKVQPDKIEFLQQIAVGKSISKIEREWFMAAGSLHYWVGKWGLKGIRPDRAQQLLDEMTIDGQAEAPTEPRGLAAINAAHKADFAMISQPDDTPVTESDKEELQEARVEFERLTTLLDGAHSANLKLHEKNKELQSEIDRLEGVLAKGRIDMQRLTTEYDVANEALKGAAVIANQSGEEIRELRERLEDRDNDLRLAQMANTEKDAEIEDLTAALSIANGTLKNKTEYIAELHNAGKKVSADYGMVTIRLPILPASVANAERARIYDAVEALGSGVEAAEIDRERVMRELFELLQRSVSFITADLAELLPGQDVSEHVQRFFLAHNDRHIDIVTAVQEAG